MHQAIAALAGALVTVAACYAVGARLTGVLRVRLYQYELFPLAFILGAACLHLAIFIVLALKIAYWPVIVGLMVAAIALGPWRARNRLKSEPVSRSLNIFLGVLFAAFTVLYFFHAWAPESSPDGPTYHLGLVARYLRAHGLERVATNMFASVGGGLEMLFVPAFAIGRHSAAALVHLAFSIALALAIVAYGRRIGKPWAGAAAALLTYASPVVGVDGSSAYNDVAAAAVVFAVFYWLQIWDEFRRDALLIPVGLLAGYAYAVKYTAFVMLPFALIFIAYRSRQWRPLIPTAACAILMVAPWMIKNWIYVQNPVAPLANQIFRNPNFHIATMQSWAEYARSYGLENKASLPVEVTLRGQRTQGIIGPIFLAAPLALLSLRERAGRRLLAAGVLLLATYFANIGARYLISCLPFFALAMALPLGNFPPALAALMVFHAVVSWPSVLRLYAPHVWRLDRITYKQALRKIPEDSYLRQIYPPYGIARMVEMYVPDGERVLAMNVIPDAYTTRDILVSFQGAFNENLANTINMGWEANRQPRLLQTFSFSEQSARRVRVLQTAIANQSEQWGVHELRFFDGGVELARRPEWRLRAWPNPWEVQFAFDNSLVTRWQTWEPSRPGMYLEVDFGKVQPLDEVRIETSIESADSKVIVQAMNNASEWEDLSRDSIFRRITPRGNLRRAATHEMHARGIHYLLIQDTDFGADDFRDDPEDWGLTPVASGYGATIYKCIEQTN